MDSTDPQTQHQRQPHPPPQQQPQHIQHQSHQLQQPPHQRQQQPQQHQPLQHPPPPTPQQSHPQHQHQHQPLSHIQQAQMPSAGYPPMPLQQYQYNHTTYRGTFPVQQTYQPSFDPAYQFGFWPQPPAHQYATPPTALSQPATKPLTKRTITRAIIKNPVTKEEIDYAVGSSSPTTTQSSSSAQSAEPSDKAKNSLSSANTTNTITSNSTKLPSINNSKSPLSIPNQLLQKVSEESLADTNSKKPQTKATTTALAASDASGSKPAPTISTETKLDTPAEKKTAPVVTKKTELLESNETAPTNTSSINTSKEAIVATTVPAATATTTATPKPTPAVNEISELRETNEPTKDEKVNSVKPEEMISQTSTMQEKLSAKDEPNVPKDTESADINGKVDDLVNCDDSNKNDDDGNALHYEKGQYNPHNNRDGRRVYSRKFLLDVSEKVCKLKVFEPTQMLDESVDPLLPLFIQKNRSIGRPGNQNQPNYSGRNSAGQEKRGFVIRPSASLPQEVELKHVKNPWKASTEVTTEQPNVADAEVLKKSFRSILNKLTPNNFENLAKKVTDLHIDTEAKLGDVIDIVFAKALAEPGYCVLYGQMCSHLKKITAGAANFGNTLLRRCQLQFQSDIYSGLNLGARREKIEQEEDLEVKKHLSEELYEEMYRCRMRGLGLIKFIGELYKIDMLNDKIMFDCIQRLLADTSEESMECLCDLLTTVGEKLDRSSQRTVKEEKKSKGASKANAYSGGQKSAAAIVAGGGSQQKTDTEAAATLDPIFEQLSKIRKDKDSTVALRIKFKILDVIELREKHNWQSKKTKDNNPKKIEEIREAHIEKLEAEKRQNATAGIRRSQDNRRLGQSGGSSSHISSLANDSDGNRGGSNMHGSSSSHSVRDQVGDNQQRAHEFENQRDHQKMVSQLNQVFKRIPNLPKQSLGKTIGLSRPSYKFAASTATASGTTSSNNTTGSGAGAGKA